MLGEKTVFVGKEGFSCESETIYPWCWTGLAVSVCECWRADPLSDPQLNVAIKPSPHH